MRPEFVAVVKNMLEIAREAGIQYDTKLVPQKTIEEDIKKEYDSLKKHDIKTLRGMIKGQHKIIDTSEFRTKDHAISHYLRTKHGDKKVAAAFGLKEDALPANVEKEDSIPNTLKQWHADPLSFNSEIADLKDCIETPQAFKADAPLLFSSSRIASKIISSETNWS